MAESNIYLIAGIVALLAVLIILFMLTRIIMIWIQAIFYGVRISLIELILMRVRKVDPATIANSMVAATKASLDLKTT